METAQLAAAQQVRRSPRTIRRWFGKKPLVPVELLQKRAASAHPRVRRPLLARSEEKALLAGIRFAIETGRPVDFVTLEYYRCLRSFLDQHGWPDESNDKNMPVQIRKAIEQLLPSGLKANSVVQGTVERDTANLTVRQIAWLQAYELLRTAAPVWPHLEPTNGEIRALCNQRIAPKMCGAFSRVREQWGDAAHILGIDLSYLETAASEPEAPHPFKDYHVHMKRVMERDVQAKLIKRVCHRFSGHPRKTSLDSDAAYLLGMTRQTAFHLRHNVEMRVGKTFKF